MSVTSGSIKTLIAGAAWIGLLAWPFTTLSAAARIALTLAAGGGIILIGLHASRSRIGRRLFEQGEAVRESLSRVAYRKIVVINTGLIVLIAALPFAVNNYAMDILNLAGIYVILALGLNIVVGLAGLLDLGYASFYAIGAYTYALLSTKAGIPFWAGLPLGGISAMAVGTLLGIVTLRLKGDYLAIVTLGFVQIVHLVLNNWDAVTHGPNGILNIARPRIGPWTLDQPIQLYYIILGVVLAAVFVVNRLNHSRIGRAWLAIREDEIAATAMGVDPVRMKVLAFALGAFWAGLAGVLFAAKFAFVSPESFTFFESVFILSMVVLGGMGSVPGVILGALTLVLLPELLREFQNARMLVFGLALVFMMVFRPQGLIGNPQRKIEMTGEDGVPVKG